MPLVRTLQARWPQTRLTWVIGRLEASLVGDLDGVEFIIFDKRGGARAWRELRRAMRGRRFDALLHMQMALRASLASLLIPAEVRLGFDRARAKDLQWVFTNARIAARPRQHVLDSFFGFAEALGVEERVLHWDVPLPGEAREFAQRLIPDDAPPTLIISPCSSMAYRNWTAEGYAALADHAAEHHGMRVLVTGGPAPIEAEYGAAICRLARHTPENLVGQTNLKQLLALLARARVLAAPDSGPAHMATAVGTPVIGLYATTNPDRARPYLSADYVVNRYPEAVREHYGKEVAEVPWGARVRTPGTMARITPEEVAAMLDRVMAETGAAAVQPSASTSR